MSEPRRIEEATVAQTKDAQIARLWAALVGLVGSSDPAELEAMKGAVAHLGTPTDSVAMLNAIDALLAVARTDPDGQA